MAAGIIPILLVFMNIVYSLTAYPAGYLSDRVGRNGLMSLGLVALIASDLTLAFADSAWGISVGTVFWGVHMGLTQGLLAAMVADTAPSAIMGTAFGIFNLMSGFAMLAASIIAGCFWEFVGARFTFFSGAVLATLALLGFLTFRKPLATIIQKGR
jgi:MFS family permease